MVLRTLYTHPVSFERLYQSLHPSSRNCTPPCILILSSHPSDAPGTTSDAGWEGNIQATKWRAEEGESHKGCTGKESTAACLCVQSAGRCGPATTSGSCSAQGTQAALREFLQPKCLSGLLWWILKNYRFSFSGIPEGKEQLWAQL